MTNMLRALVGAAAAATLALTGCSAAGQAEDDGTLRVAAAFYPLEYIVAEVGGSEVSIDALTEPGAEPHDLELSPGRLRDLAGSDLIVYLDGFQAAVDDAVDQLGDVEALEVGAEARLREFSESGPADEHADEHEDEGHAGPDPHFWLDPDRVAAVGDAVADRLASVDPKHATGYRSRAGALRERMTALDAAYRSGLRTCERRTLVTAHEAFGYLADRYDLDQVGIAGITPDQEPSPADLARISRLVRDEGVGTVFTETLVSPAVASTVAEAAGVHTAVLDPVEGITEESAGKDYGSVMEANLVTLREGLGCR